MTGGPYTPGNGGNLTLTGNYGKTGTYAVTAKNSMGCTKQVYSKNIAVYDNNVDFSNNFSYLIGELVNIQNKSAVDSYVWRFDYGASFADVTVKTPPAYSYVSDGNKKITLIGTSRFNCVDSVTHDLTVFANKAPKSSAALCYINNLSLPGQEVSAMHTDAQGNVYIATYWGIAYNGGNFSGSYLHAVQKFDKSGKLVWNVAQDFFKNNYSNYNYYSSYINGITTDTAGNVYVAGNYASDKFKFAGLTAGTFSNAHATPFIAKLDKNGLGKWIITEETPGNNANSITELGCSDIKYVDDNHIYVSLYNASNLVFTNGVKQIFSSSSKLNIIQIDAAGKFIKNTSVSGTFYAYTNPNTSSYSTGKTRTASPKMHLLNNGKILIYGKLKDNVSFGSYIVSTDASDYGSGFIAQLDPVSGWENAFKTYGLAQPISYNNFAYLTGANTFMTVSADENSVYVADGFLYPYNATIPPEVVFSFPNGKKHSSTYSGNFIAKYSIQGNISWINYSNTGQISGLGYNKANNEVVRYGSYISNYFGQTSQSAESLAIASNGGANDLYLSGLNASGNVTWIEPIGGKGNEGGSYLTVNSCNDICVLGYTDTKMSILGDTVYSGSGTHFYARVTSSGQCNSTCNSGVKKPLTVALYTELPAESNILPYPLKVVFNSPVSNFASNDIKIANGVVSNFSGSGTNYTFYISPTNTNNISIQIPESVAADANSQLNSASAVLSIKIDTTSPKITITKLSSPYVKSSAYITMTFSESYLYKDLLSSDLILHNCTVSGYNKTSMTLVPITEGPFYFEIPSGSISDRAGNINPKVVSETYIYDKTPPTFFTANCDSTIHTAKNIDTITVVFSEKLSFFSSSAMISSSGSTIKILDQINDSTYQVEYTMSTTGCHYIYFGWSLGYIDLAGNYSNLKCEINYCYDPTNPVVYSIVANGTSNPTKDSLIKVKVTFSETITGFDASDLVVTNATIISITKNTSVSYDLVLSNIGNGTVTVKVNAKAVKNLAGLDNINESSLFSIVYHKSDVTVHVSSVVPALTNKSFVVDFTFSKAVTGFTLNDIYVANGTLSALSGSGNTYKATLTPIFDGTVVVYVFKGAAVDASGNATLQSDTLHTQYDGTAPTFTLTTTTASLTRDKIMPFTLIFNEHVVNFDSTKITLINATFASYSYSNDSCYFTITPTTPGMVYVRLYNAKVSDAAGNTNSYSTIGIKYQGDDYTVPNMKLIAQKNITNTTVVFDVKVSEKVYDFYSSVKIKNGTIKALTLINDTTYKLEVNATKSGWVKVYVDAGTYTDIAFNPGTFADTAFTLFDNNAPFAVFTPVSCDTLLHEYIRYKIVFNEAVKNLTTSSFISQLGAVSNLSGSDSIYYFDFVLNQGHDSCVIKSPYSYIFRLFDSYVIDNAGNKVISASITSFCFPNRTLVTGVNSLSTENVQIYPNPADNFVIIYLSGELNIHSINITNALGQFIFQKTGEFKNQLVQLNISTFVAGTYFINLKTEDEVIVKKLIIK